MSTDTKHLSRRRFLKLGAMGVVAIPAIGLLSQRSAFAAEPLLLATDTQAAAMHYTPDAAKAGPMRKANAFCHTCQMFTPTGDGKTGTCQIFAGKRVNKNGWCVAWTQRSA